MNKEEKFFKWVNELSEIARSKLMMHIFGAMITLNTAASMVEDNHRAKEEILAQLELEDD